MPAFVLVTGYLSRNFTWNRRSLRKLVNSVAVPYVIFEGALVAFRESVTGSDFNHVWLEPHWPMWYLAALFIWRMATPVLRRTPHLLPVAIGACLAFGMVP